MCAERWWFSCNKFIHAEFRDSWEWKLAGYEEWGETIIADCFCKSHKLIILCTFQFQFNAQDEGKWERRSHAFLMLISNRGMSLKSMGQS